MKIDYEQPTPTNHITLDDIMYGTIFRPINTRRVFMLTSIDGMNELLSSSCPHLENNIEEFTHHFDEAVQEYDDLLLCVDLYTGNPSLIDKHTFLEEIDYSFVIKEKK